MPFLPKQLATLVGGDTMLARVSTNVRAAVQPTLDFLNTYLQAGPDGSLVFLRDLVAQANAYLNGSLNVLGPTQLGATLGVNGLASLNNGLNVSGPFMLRGTQVILASANNALVVIPFTPSGAAFYTTDPSNSQSNFIVFGDGRVFGVNAWQTTSLNTTQALSSSGTLTVAGTTTLNGATTINQTLAVSGTVTSASPVTGSNIVSQAGIIGSEYEGSYNGQPAAGSYTLINDPTSTLPLNWRMPRAGSIVGIYYQATQNVTSNAACQLYKNNGFFTGASTPTVPITTNMGNISATFAKGVLPFNAGDFIRPATYTSASAQALGGYHRCYLQVLVEWTS